MKRIILFLLIFLVAGDAVWCIVIRPWRNEVAAFFDKRLPNRRELAAAGRWLAESRAVRQFASGDWLKPQPLEPLELIPEDALLTLDTENAFATVQALIASRFGRTAAAICWPSVLQQLEVTEFINLLLERQAEELKSLLANPILQDIFSRRTVVALLSPNNPQQFREDPLRTVQEYSLLLANPQKGSTAAELLSLANAVGGEQELLYHQGIGILVFNLKQGRKLHVAAIGGRIAFSLSLQPVQRSIDTFVRHFFFRQNGMLRNRDYAEMKAEAKGKDDVFLYADLIRLRSLLGSEEAVAGLPSAFRSLSLFHQCRGEAVQFKAAVRFSPEHLPPMQKELLATGPVLNRTLGKMPASLPFYFWSGWLEPDFWQKLLDTVGQEATTELAETWFKEKTGLALSEILALFGREFSVNISEISTTGFFPVPRLCFILEVREQNKAERLLARLISGLPVKRDNVAGTQVVSLQAAQGMLQPAYAFADGFLLLADSREQLVDILDGQSERMPENRTFLAAASGMEQPSNLMLFVRAAQLVEGLKELAAWAGTMTAISDEQAGAKSKVLIDQVITPLLDSLSSCGAVSLRSVVRPGELLVEASALHAEKTLAEPVHVQAEN